MHEQSIVESLLSIALNEAGKSGAKRIISIRLIVGELTGMEKEPMEFYFRFLAENTIAAGASLDLNYTKAQLRCRDCDIIFPKYKLNYNCPECGKKAVEIVGGRELYIESMEVE